MAGFFEFSLMRVRGDIDQRLLAELFYQYLNVEEDFIKALFVNGETQLGRIFVHEPALPPDKSLHVLDYERASETIKTARHRAVGMCYCRHKMKHLDRACDAPMDICLTFGTTARSLSKHGIARTIGVEESLDLLRPGLRTEPRSIRRKRPPPRQFHLQLLRMLLRGAGRNQALRIRLPDSHEFSAARRRADLHRLRQVRGRLPGGSHGPCHGQRSPAVRNNERRAWTRNRAWVAASASAICSNRSLVLESRPAVCSPPLIRSIGRS